MVREGSQAGGTWGKGLETGIGLVPALRGTAGQVPGRRERHALHLELCWVASHARFLLPLTNSDRQVMVTSIMPERPTQREGRQCFKVTLEGRAVPGTQDV